MWRPRMGLGERQARFIEQVAAAWLLSCVFLRTLEDRDPADDQKLAVPGADWLALRGIGSLSNSPVGSEIRTSGVLGRWKTGTFSPDQGGYGAFSRPNRR